MRRLLAVHIAMRLARRADKLAQLRCDEQGKGNCAIAEVLLNRICYLRYWAQELSR